MEDNPFESPKVPADAEQDSSNPKTKPTGEGDISDPFLAYTAAGNLEVHAVVMWLESNGVPAYAVEDNSGVSLFSLGTLSQFHQPQVFVNKSDGEKAAELIRQFESQQKELSPIEVGASILLAKCEKCGKSSEFSADLDGTTQNCPKCQAFMDVGTFDWPEDFDFGEEEPEPESKPVVEPEPTTPEEALDAAGKLDSQGDWHEAIAAYRKVAERWPEHETYVANCIAEVEMKLKM